MASGLKLRRRTVAHLHDLSASREYLIIRYGPELNDTASQLNRLSATLNEIAEKVSAIVDQKGRQIRPTAVLPA